MEIFKELGLKEKELNINLLLVEVNIFNEKYDEALNLCNACISTIEANPSFKRHLESVYQKLIVVHDKFVGMGQNEFIKQFVGEVNSKEHLKESLKYSLLYFDIIKSKTEKNAIADLLVSISIKEYQLEKYEDALNRTYKALEIYDELSQKLEQIKPLTLVGACCEKLKRHKEAIPYILKSLEISLDLKDVTNEALSCFCLAGLYQNSGDKNKAIEMYDRVINLSLIHRFNDTFESQSFEKIQYIYLELRNPQKAIEYRLKELELAKIYQDKERIFKITILIGQIHSLTKNYKESSNYYKQCISMGEKESILIWKVNALFYLARDSKIFDLNQSIEYSNEIISITKNDAKYKEFIFASFKNLSECYEALKDPVKSKFYLEKFQKKELK